MLLTYKLLATNQECARIGSGGLNFVALAEVQTVANIWVLNWDDFVLKTILF